jgi:hypothetical protein
MKFLPFLLVACSSHEEHVQETSLEMDRLVLAMRLKIDFIKAACPCGAKEVDDNAVFYPRLEITCNPCFACPAP